MVMAELDFGGDHSGHNHGDLSSFVYMYPDGDILMVCALRLSRSQSNASLLTVWLAAGRSWRHR